MLLESKKVPARTTYVLAFVAYLLIAFLRFPGITLNITGTIPGANGDAYQNLWGMWWVAYAVFHLHQSIYYTNLLFWPVGASLIYETMSPLGSLITAPLQALSIPSAYNALFFLGFPLSGIGMFALADYVTKSKRASFVAGMAYAFGAFHIAQAYAHIDWMVIGWMPLSVYFLMRLLKEERNYYNVAGLALSFVSGVFIGDMEQGVIALMLYLAIVIAYLVPKYTRRLVLRKAVAYQLALAALLVFVLGSWMFVPVLELLVGPSANATGQGLVSVTNQLSTVQYNKLESLDVLSFFLPNFYNGIVRGSAFLGYYLRVFSASPIEKTGYLAYTAIALAIIGMLQDRRRGALWAGIMLVFGLLALGPYIGIAGVSTGMPGPYLAYRAIPLVNIVMEPGRFDSAVIIAISVLAACGYVRAEELLGRHKYAKKETHYLVMVSALSLLLLAEAAGSPITNNHAISSATTTPEIPLFYHMLRNLSGNFSVLQLPALQSSNGLPNLYVGEAEYYMAAARKPLVGGYVTRENYTDTLYMLSLPLAVQSTSIQNYGASIYTSPVNEDYTSQTLLMLYNFRTAFVVINTAAYNRTSLAYLYNYLADTFGDPVYADNSTVAFATYNAVSASLFRSFVAYPVLLEWAYAGVTYKNGSAPGPWVPRNGGRLEVYAPYPNGVNATAALHFNDQYTVNATLRFDALSEYGPTQLRIFEQAGTATPAPVAIINVTAVPTQYSLELRGLASGERGNCVMFVESNNATPVLVSNIRVSGHA
jgi:hypothetical protein